MAPQTQEFTPNLLPNWTQRLMRLVSCRIITQPLEIGFCQGVLEVDFNPDQSQGPLEKADIVFQWEGRSLGLVFGAKQGLDTILGVENDRSPVFGINPKTLPRPVFLALLEAVLEPASTYLSALVGAQVAMADPEQVPAFSTPGLARLPDPAAHAVLNVSFKTENGKPVSGRLYLPCDPSLLDALEPVLSRYRARTLPLSAVEGIRAVAAFCIGETMVKASDLKGLEKGDVLVPDIWHFSKNEGMMRIAPFSFRFSFGTGTDQGQDGQDRGGSPINILLLEEGVRRVDTESAMDSIEEIDIKVCFEIDRRMMTVKEIRALVKNSIIPLGQAPEQGVVVDIVAGGRRIGKGKVVSLGQTLGVQVIEARGAEPVNAREPHEEAMG